MRAEDHAQVGTSHDLASLEPEVGPGREDEFVLHEELSDARVGTKTRLVEEKPTLTAPRFTHDKSPSGYQRNTCALADIELESNLLGQVEAGRNRTAHPRRADAGEEANVARRGCVRCDEAAFPERFVGCGGRVPFLYPPTRGSSR